MEKQISLALNFEFSYKEIALFLSKSLLALGVFLLPFGISLTGTVLFAAVGFALLSGWGEEKWRLLAHYKTTRWIILFGFIIFFGFFYSGGTEKNALEGLIKYDKILYFIIFLPLAKDMVFRRIIISALIMGAVFSMLLGSDANPIDTRFIMGFATFVLLRRIIDGESWRWLNILLFSLMSVYLLFYNVERTGYLIFFGGLATTFWQVFRWRGMVLGASLIFSLMVALYWLSPVFQFRVQQGFSEAVSYLSEEANLQRAIGEQLGFIAIRNAQSLEEKNISLYEAYKVKSGLSVQKDWFLNPYAHISKSSIGLRLGFLQYSWGEIKKHVWFGNGTGSFKDVYWASGGPKIDVAPLGHPHNEYVLILFQWGIVGLIIFLMWQMTLWWESFRLPLHEQALLQGLLVCFAILGFCNVSLYVNPPGDVFIILSAILLASKKDARGKLCVLQ